MSTNTKIVSPEESNGLYSHSGNAVFGDVAYVPGSGPPTSCKNCSAIRHARNASVWGKCRQAATFRNIDVEDIGFIRLDTPACKYYADRPEDLKPWTGWYGCEAPPEVASPADSE